MTIPRWSEVVIHHSLGPDNVLRMSADEIHKFHTDPEPAGRGWSDTGYQRIVEKVEGVYVAITGRPENRDGSHAPPHNHVALGLCLVGNFDLAPPPRDMLVFAARYVICPWIDNFHMDFPGCLKLHSEVTPHRTCPGALFDKAVLIEIVAAELGFR